MKKYLVFMGAFLALTNVALACGPLPFCDEGKYLRQDCSKPFVMYEYLSMVDLNLMAHACQSVGMTMKVIPDPDFSFRDQNFKK
jgi:hypothetical protein